MRSIRSDRRVHQGLVEPSVGQRVDQRLAVDGRLRQLAVDARPEAEPGGDGQVGGQPVLGREHLDRGVVGDDDAVEPPLVAEDRGQELPRGVARHAVDVAVGRHHARQAGRPDRGFEREAAARPAARACPTWTGAWLSPPSASPCPTMCLPVASTPSTSVGALEPADVRTAELGGQVRVLAVRLLDAAPARVARDVQDGTQRLPSSSRQHPSAKRCRHLLDEVGVPRGRGPDGLLERRRVAGEQAVEGLLVEDRRDPQPRLLDQEPLDLVAGGRDAAAHPGSCRRRSA